MADSTTLLHEQHDSDEREHTQTHAFVNLLKGINFVASVLALALLVAVHITINRSPTGSRVWDALETTKLLAIWMLLSVIFSAINVAVNIHNLINIVIDIVLAATISPYVVNLILSLPSSDWCKRYRYPPYPSPPEELPVDPKCEEWKTVILCLMIAGAAFAGIVGIIYFVLLIIRAAAIIKSKFWRRFMVGPGEFSITLSIKLNKPEANVNQLHDGEEAGPSSGRGAVYI